MNGPVGAGAGDVPGEHAHAARAHVQRPLRAFEIADQELERVLVDVLEDARRRRAAPGGR